LTHAVVGAVLFMLLFITGSVMMQSIRERVPEFAMLKTVGFSDASVMCFVITESVLLCVFAAVIGLLLSKPLMSIVRTPPYSSFPFQTSWAVTLSALGLALIIALASASGRSYLPGPSLTWHVGLAFGRHASHLMYGMS
jgi:putative ABC transport system permease protein